MPVATYSFIDIAVLDGIRDRFARGDALVLMSPDLDRVIWANGPGAALIDHRDIESAMDSPASLSVPARRQIRSLSGYPEIGSGRSVSVRLAQGMSSRVVTLSASGMKLPGGEPAILFAAPAANEGKGADAIARAAIRGFAEAGYAAAMIAADGSIVAATDEFDTLGLGRTALWTLVEDVGREADRLVKRLVPVGGGILPVGFAQLTDPPALHLLVTADRPLPPEAFAPEAEDEPENDATAAEIEAETEPQAEDRPEPVPQHEPEPRDLPAQPVRFVWRTDAQGRFSQISPEFVEAVGANAADVIGRGFRDVATVFGFDLDEEIANLLDRRDTWSGRTVFWPVEGRALKVPVDLAALPVYDRDRIFEGFRGFGVARMSDAVEDPDALGLALAAPDNPSEAPAENPAEDPFGGEAPALLTDSGPGRRHGDKVVQLDELRAATPKRGLSPGERQAFHEIGRKLKRHTDGEVAPPPAPPPAESPEAPAPDAALPGNVVVLADMKGESEAERQRETAAEEPRPVAQLHFLPSAFAPQQGAAHAEDALVGHLPVATLIHAGDRLHFANPAFLDLTGFASLEDFEEAGGLDALFGEDCGSPGYEGVLNLSRADGAERPVRAHLHAVPWHGGKALMLTLLPHEAAPSPVEPEPAEPEEDGADELRARLAEMHAIIDTATDGVILIDNSGAIRSISKPAEALFGLDGGAIEGRPFRELFAIESQRTAQDYLNRLTQGGMARVMNDGREVIGREAEGGFIPLFMTIGRLPQDGGYCAVLRDITPWKRAEEELTQARAEAERSSSHKSEFLARISHEIRTPLNAIIGFSELIINESFGPIGTERYRDYLRDISRSGNHVLDLVNDLLDISKIEAGEQEMNYESVSLNDVLAESVAMMQPQANRERVIIRSSFASRLPDVVADLRSIRQIALNLLSNAVRYTPAGGQVILSTAMEADGGIAMRVRDTGIGMTPSEIDQALKPFKRVNALKRSHREGTGLGLPLTKAMVEANRARFTISSKPGEGTLVEIDFPATRVLSG